MIKISDLQKRIKDSLSDCCRSIGFNIEASPTFYNAKNDIIRILHIDFLNRRHAEYFNSNTASFTINLGVFFNFEGKISFYPKEYEAHIRGHIIKDFRQTNPMDLKGFSLFHPEKRRRDIWWVESDGSNLDYLLTNAGRLLKAKAVRWLDKYSDIDYVIYFLETKHGTEVWQEGPWGLGSIGSPGRQNLIEKLKTKKG